MRILVTNDDGIGAIGLKKLVSVALKYGEVTVVAPKIEQSAKSHAISVRTPFEFKKIEDILPNVNTYYIDSTPADCVRVAYFYLKSDFDVVFSGVNSGYNLGEDITYSGTCAAATEGALLGKKGIAISTDFNTIDKIDDDLDAVLSYIFRNKILDVCNLLNVNIPYKHEGISFARQGKTHYYSNYENKCGFISSIGRPIVIKDEIINSDVDLIYNNKATIMPMVYNRTDESLLEMLINKNI